MKLSFVIPAYNEEDSIGKCLDSVLAQTKEYPGIIEVIVVDNGSTDQTKEILSKYPQVTVLDEKRKGPAWARETGLKASTGELVAAIDADTMLTPGWLKTVFREFTSNPKLVGLSGPFKYYDLPKHLTVWLPAYYALAYFFYILNRFILRIGSVVQGGNFVFTRAAFEKMGGYDTSIEFYGDDTDIARRLHKIGDVKFTTKLPIYTSGRRLASDGMFTMAARYGINYLAVQFFKKPKDKKYNDVRSTEKSGILKYKPKSNVIEILSAIGMFAVAGLILAVTGLVLYGAIYGIRFVFSLNH